MQRRAKQLAFVGLTIVALQLYFLDPSYYSSQKGRQRRQKFEKKTSLSEMKQRLISFTMVEDRGKRSGAACRSLNTLQTLFWKSSSIPVTRPPLRVTSCTVHWHFHISKSKSSQQMCVYAAHPRCFPYFSCSSAFRVSSRVVASYPWLGYPQLLRTDPESSTPDLPALPLWLCAAASSAVRSYRQVSPCSSSR